MTGRTDNLLATIEAERAIFRTFHHFFRIADTQDSERFSECFTPDALIEYRIMPGPVQRFHGRDEESDDRRGGDRRTRDAAEYAADRPAREPTCQRPDGGTCADRAGEPVPGGQFPVVGGLPRRALLEGQRHRAVGSVLEVEPRREHGIVPGYLRGDRKDEIIDTER
ncbi:nuclear transport factor 2 family protein [Nocardia sp. NBC_01377]|uniref:nuclear transport factor 2 family protein n=1 Tax=Nocardia sp. NBC_01377 TaxID=2903595 RepID=UPI0038706CAE